MILFELYMIKSSFKKQKNLGFALDQNHSRCIKLRWNTENVAAVVQLWIWIFMKHAQRYEICSELWTAEKVILEPH